MLYKNDNPDELFQKAARDYPLKTDSSDWETLADKLNRSGKAASVKDEMWKYAAIFLLLAGGTLILNKYQDIPEKSKQQQNTRQDITKQQHKSLKQPSHTELSIADNSSNNTMDNTAIINVKEASKHQYAAPLNNDYLQIESNVGNIKSQLTVNRSLTNSPLINNTENILQSIQSVDNEAKDKQTSDESYNSRPDNDNIESGSSDRREEHVVSVSMNRSYRIYGSLFGGPEFSTVKSQQFDKPGYKIGIALGYRINKRFNVEIGLQREHINFYSDGKYIDTSMLRIKAHASVENVNASSKLTSVPVTLKYNFLSKSNGHFFVSTGINAIIITHSEQYQYAVSKNGVEKNLSRNYSALRAPKYFTGPNVSAGYETKLSKLCSIKIESYYQAPISDFGVGKLPVSNFGLNIGIVKDLK